MRYTFRPLQPWTDPVTNPRRSRSTFKAGWQSTINLLAAELRHLDAQNVVIEADFRERDLRLDGLPRADAKVPAFPGVRVAFDSRHGPLVYATDSCAYWQHNVRSIALGLEALRAVDRYGITRRGEQYTGWKQLTAGPGTPTTREEAQALIDSYGGLRAAFRATHPDHGGNPADFQRVKEARRVLGI